jgi:hypothetical protein
MADDQIVGFFDSIGQKATCAAQKAMSALGGDLNRSPQHIG